jgi:hypothetical protein
LHRVVKSRLRIGVILMERHVQIINDIDAADKSGVRVHRHELAVQTTQA